MSSQDPISSIIQNIAAGIATEIIGKSAAYLKHRSLETQLADLQQVYERALVQMLAYVTDHVSDNEYDLQHFDSVFREFVNKDGVAEWLLDLALSPEEVSFDLMRSVFYDQGFDPKTLPFSALMTTLINALEYEAEEEAKNQGVAYRVILSRLPKHRKQTIQTTKAKLLNVPSLPPQLLIREKEVKSLADLILGSARALSGLMTVISSTSGREELIKPTAVRGMGGIGKSVLAVMVTELEEIRHTFQDGIIWISLGRDPVINLALQSAGRALGDTRDYSQQDAPILLQQMLESKTCLLILDDVWEVKHTDPFRRVLRGSRSQLLITSRDSGLAKSIGAVEFPLGVLEVGDARQLLANYVGQPETALPSEASQVVEECGGLPLALAICGAMARDGASWLFIRDSLQNADLEEIEHSLPEYEMGLFKALKVSVDMLERQLTERYKDAEHAAAYIRHYHEFVVFPTNRDIPEEVLLRLWEYTGGIDKSRGSSFISKLADKQLLRVEGTAPNRRITMHDLQHDYLRAVMRNQIQPTHLDLVSAYRAACDNQLIEGPNDGYFFQNLSYHLYHSGEKPELYSLLTDNPAWMSKKFLVTLGDASFVADLELALRDMNDPVKPEDWLNIVKLWATRHIIRSREERYTNIDLQILTWTNREREALAHARLRDEPSLQAEGLISIFEAKEKWNLIDVSLLNDARKLVDAIHDLYKRAKTLRDIAVAFAYTSNSDEAFATVQSIQDKEIRLNALSDIARVLTLKGQLELAKELSKTTGTVNQAKVLCAIAIALVELKDERASSVLEDIQTLINVIEDIRNKAEIQYLITKILDLMGRTQEALVVAVTIKDFGKRLAALEIVVGGLARAGRIADARRLTRGMGAGTGPYRSIAMSLAHSERFEDARRITLMIQEPEIRAEALNKIVASLLRAGKIEQAQELTSSIQDIKMQTETITDIAIELTRNGELAKARQLAASTGNASAQSKVLRGIAAILAQAKDPCATDIFEEAIRAETAFKDLENRANTLSAIVAALIRLSYLNPALEVARIIQDSRVRTKALEDCAEAFIRANRLSDAYEISMSFWGNSKALWSVAIGYAQAGQIERAREIAITIPGRSTRADALQIIAEIVISTDEKTAFSLLLEACENLNLQTNKRVRHDSFRDSVLLRIVDGLVKLRQIEKAKWVALNISGLQIQAEALGHIALALTRAGNVSEVQQMAANTRNVEGKGRVLGHIIEALAEMGQIDEALRTLSFLQDRTFHSSAIRFVIIALTRKERFKEARALVSNVRGAGIRGDILLSMAVTIAEMGDVGRAQEIVAEIKDTTIRAEALLTIGNSLLSARNNQALSILHQAQEVAAEITDATARTETLLAIGISLFSAPNNQASSILHQAKESAATIIDVQKRESAVGNIILTLARAGYYEDARNTVLQLNSSNQKTALLCRVANLCNQVGEHDQALKCLRQAQSLLRTIENETERLTLLNYIVCEFMDTGYLAEGLRLLQVSSTPNFVQTIAELTRCNLFPHCYVSIETLQEVLRIVSWVHQSWTPVLELLAQES